MSDFILLVPILLFSVVAHEYAHAWVAYREGDTTAHEQGRLTLNPLPHIDPMMSILVPVMLWYVSNGGFTFGAARPVPVVPKNFRRGALSDILVSSAGVAMNALIAVGCIGLFVGAGMLAGAVPALSDTLEVLQQMLTMGIYLNVLLVFFNLLPIPPLDGSHLIVHALPRALAAQYRRFAPMGVLLLLALMIVPGLSARLFWPVEQVSRAAMNAIGGYAIP